MDKKYQGLNIGEVAGRLLEGLEDDLKGHGVKKLFANVVDKQDQGHGFYLKHGRAQRNPSRWDSRETGMKFDNVTQRVIPNCSEKSHLAKAEPAGQ